MSGIEPSRWSNRHGVEELLPVVANFIDYQT
jgi:hypothetical protein